MFIITSHAKERMEKYFITEEMIKDCLSSPDKIIDTYEKRKIYQKNING